MIVVTVSEEDMWSPHPVYTAMVQIELRNDFIGTITGITAGVEKHD
jgi:hypothetical protein